MKQRTFGLLVFALMWHAPAVGQEWQANEQALSNLYTGKAYSPYAGRDFPSYPLWGTLTCTRHCHLTLAGSATACRSAKQTFDADRYVG